MALLGMNTYIYAPKDDLKHRIHWRDLYSVDEAGICCGNVLVSCCCFVTHLYATVTDGCWKYYIFKLSVCVCACFLSMFVSTVSPFRKLPPNLQL